MCEISFVSRLVQLVSQPLLFHLFLFLVVWFIGVVNQLRCFTLWSWWHSSVQNNANASSIETITCHVPYAGHEGTYRRYTKTQTSPHRSFLVFIWITLHFAYAHTPLKINQKKNNSLICHFNDLAMKISFDVKFIGWILDFHFRLLIEFLEC